MFPIPAIMRLLFAMIAGILLADLLQSVFPLYIIGILSVVVASIAFILRASSRFVIRVRSQLWTGAALLLFFTGVGYVKTLSDVSPIEHEKRRERMLLEVQTSGKQKPKTTAYRVKHTDTEREYMLYLRGEHSLMPGDMLRADAVVYPLSDTIPYHDYLHRHGISGTLFARNAEIIENQNVSLLLQLRRTSENIRMWCSYRLDYSDAPDAVKALCLGCLFGDKSGFSSDVIEDFSYSGMSHLLAVSGLHVGVVFAIISFILLFFKRLISNVLLRIISLIFLWGYILLVGFPPSAIRAAVMFTLMVVSGLLRRDSFGWHSLSVAALFLLLYDSRLLWDLSFQMSFLAAAGILLVRPDLHALAQMKNIHYPSYVNKKSLRWRCFRLGRYIMVWLYSSLLVTFSAQLFTLPLVLYYFHHLPLLSFLPTLLVLPLLTLFLLLLILFLAIHFCIFFFSVGLFYDFFIGLSDFCWIGVEYLAYWILSVAHWTHDMDLFLFGDILWYPDQLDVFLMYLLLSLIVLYWRVYRTRYN